MKKLIIILLFATLLSCSDKEECNFPPPPYGQPSHVSQYSSKGYNTITYTYFCYNNRYTAVTYTNTTECRWSTSYYYSNCI